ncbi:unnamed protein product [Scytosiphon promiscuus]
MPGHDEEHKGGPGKHGGPDHKPGHGPPGKEGPPHGGPPHGGPGGRGGRRKGGRGKKRPDDDDDTEDEDSEEEDDEEDPCDDDEEEKNPGLRRAGRIAGKKWKREHGIEGKIKDLNPQQKKEIRAIKKAARVEFRRANRK